jgi:HAD domain in Swiss Army Knife RNA repair proteins
MVASQAVGTHLDGRPTPSCLIDLQSRKGRTDLRSEVDRQVLPCFDVTPVFDEADDVRGYEIQAWLELHPEVDRYAILDDDTDFLEHRLPNFFHTSPNRGITQRLADKIVAHLLS